MQKYVKIWMEENGYDIGDWIPCKVCGKSAADLHHILGRIGDLKLNPEYIVPLCRDCHTKAHNEEISKETLLKLIK